MQELTKSIQKAAEEGNFNPERLLDFLKSFFGESRLESWVSLYTPQINLGVIILQKNAFFHFEYTKATNIVKVISVPIKNIDKIEETFNGSHYYCDYYSNNQIIFKTNTLSIDLIRLLRGFANQVLARM